MALNDREPTQSPNGKSTAMAALEPCMSLAGERPRVYVVILNYNGWADTIECLENVLRLAYANYQIVLVDNASQNGSVENIKLWAEGKLNVCRGNHNSLRHLSHPPLDKPVPLIEYDHQTAERGGDAALESRHRSQSPACEPIILINSGGNLGFAGGNNVGLRYALKRNDFDYAWLLNNDTVVEPTALDKLVERMQEKPAAGMCGSTHLYYHQPDCIQAMGGATYNRWLALSKHIGVFDPATIQIDAERIEKRFSYICGSSMLVSRPFLDAIGLMCEDYFLYFEELDWTTRAKGQFDMVYAPGSIVYHKEGGSIGSSSDGSKKSKMSDFHALNNRVVFTRKFFPWALPTVYVGLLATTINRIRRKQWDRVLMIIRIGLRVC